jgi:hypothetical protein
MSADLIRTHGGKEIDRKGKQQERRGNRNERK